MHLRIVLPDGTEALSTFGADPLELTIGDGTLVPELERLLTGLEAGADAPILADGAELFGPRDESKIHWLARSDFPSHVEPAPGQVVAFETPGGQETAGVVLAMHAERIQVDFNHPLAGRPLQIRARILSIT
jgi:FKBP-type peptidyl-prolyl cis-trans isomerase SlpA